MSTEDTTAFANMSKRQLYDFMVQLKLLVAENKEVAKQMLVANPELTRSLFQAQITLGMVKPYQKPNTQQVVTQPTSKKVGQQSNIQNMQLLPVHSGNPSQTISSQPLVLSKPQLSISLSSPSNPPLNLQSQLEPSILQHSTQQAKGQVGAQIPSISAPQSSQIHSLPLPPTPTTHYSTLHAHMPTSSSQPLPSLQIPGVLNQPLQPPLPPQPRPPSMQPFSHQLHAQMPHSLGFQPTNGPQPLFHSGSTPPSSFPQGQPPLPSQPPPQQLYQGGPYAGSEYSNHGKMPMPLERGSPWAPGLPERAKDEPHFLGTPPLVSAQMAPSSSRNQIPHPPVYTPAMEKDVFEQVRSLTPEQINSLAPEQRQQVIELQKMLRQ